MAFPFGGLRFFFLVRIVERSYLSKSSEIQGKDWNP